MKPGSILKMASLICKTHTRRVSANVAIAYDVAPVEEVEDICDGKGA